MNSCYLLCINEYMFLYLYLFSVFFLFLFIFDTCSPRSWVYLRKRNTCLKQIQNRQAIRRTKAKTSNRRHRR